MDLSNLISKHSPIKSKSSVDVLAVSSDRDVQLTHLKPLRQFLVISTDEDENDAVWGIDALKPFVRMNGSVINCQVILEDACVPQRTSFEEPYRNPNIANIRDDIYHKTHSWLEREYHKQLSLRSLQYCIAGVVILFIIAMLFA